MLASVRLRSSNDLFVIALPCHPRTLNSAAVVGVVIFVQQLHT
jgi:hypothetical protein